MDKKLTKVYNGYERRPNQSGETQELFVKDASGAELKLDQDYRLDLYNNIDAGTATVMITGMDKFGGRVVKTFKILPAKEAEIVAESSGNSVYTPDGALPQIKVVDYTSERYFTEGVDYRLKCSNNRKAGKASYSISFIGNYKGHKALAKKEYTIDPAAFDVKLTVPDVIYTKASAFRSTVYVSDAEGNLLSEKDYKVEYLDEGGNALTELVMNEDQNEAEVTVKVTGQNNYAGTSVTGKYRVLKAAQGADLSKAKIKVTGAQEYHTKGARPEIEVTVGSEKLASDAYRVVYLSNGKPGKAVILVLGVDGKSYGSKAVNFKVSKKKLEVK